MRVVIEMLGARRAAAMTSPDEIARLLDELAAPDVFTTAIDTGHLLDAGSDPAAILRRWELPLEELQLRGNDGAPPGRDDPVEQWLGAAASRPRIVCMEHPRPIALADFEALLARVRART